MDLIATLTIIVLGVVLIRFYATTPKVGGARPPTNQRTAPNREITKQAPISLRGVPLKGSGIAKVGMIEFGDFQCPFCAKFAKETLPIVERAYVDGGKVAVGFMHLPLEGSHPLALRAAQLATCAQGRGQFWPFFDVAYSSTSILNEELLIAAATRAGIQEVEHGECFSSNNSERIKNDTAIAKNFGISGTPTFLAGVVLDGALHVRQKLTGAAPVAEFRRVLDALLNEVEAQRPK